MKISWKFALIVCLLSMSPRAFVRAQESAPQEPPYVEENNEFDDSLSIEDEIMQAQPTQPAQDNTVNLNEGIPESGDSLEDELNAVEEAPVIPVAPTVEPSPAPAPARPISTPRIQRQNAKGGIEYIEHPNAAKGLIRIDKDGTYVYRISEDLKEKKGRSGSLRFGSMDPPKISSGDPPNTTFQQMYTSSMVPVLLFDYEWQPFERFGKLGVTAGFGFLTASGNGFMNDPSNPGQYVKAEEKYTFIGVPLSAGLVYRMEFVSNQWVAPYISGGGTFLGVMEMRDDGKTPSFTGVPGAYGAGGLLFNISRLSADTAFNLRSEYGVQNLWIMAEYRYLATFDDALDFTSGIVNVGVAVDY